MFLWKLLIESGLYLNLNKSGDLPFQDFCFKAFGLYNNGKQGNIVREF